MIELDKLQPFVIAWVIHGEGDERIHLGSARRDGTLLVLHEVNGDIDCCGGRVCVVPLTSVTELHVLPDAESLRRAVEDDGIAPPGTVVRPLTGPEVR